MRIIIIRETDADEREGYLAAQAASYGIKEHTGIDVGQVVHVDNQQLRADCTERMTFLQMVRLWSLCGGFNTPFHEEDFKPGGFLPEGWVTGWIDGRFEVGVSPEGEASS